MSIETVFYSRFLRIIFQFMSLFIIALTCSLSISLFFLFGNVAFEIYFYFSLLLVIIISARLSQSYREFQEQITQGLIISNTNGEEKKDNNDEDFIPKDEREELLWKWCKGGTVKGLGLQPMTLNRMLREFVHETLKEKRKK